MAYLQDHLSLEDTGLLYVLAAGVTSIVLLCYEAQQDWQKRNSRLAHHENGMVMPPDKHQWGLNASKILALLL